MAVFPIDVRPPRPGDGSGLVERKQTPRDRYEADRYGESYARKIQRRRRRARVRQGFGLIFDNNAKE